ncbi:MAG: SRPBCC domain-containing protein [Solirubrobacteraceae bacterium]|nr:SRPBCC domain-containing protein [Solirubrobacteraceae bacterium]
MAPVRKWVPASPADVWAILADPRSYAFWVVGSHDVPQFDGDWPEPGSTFRHVQGHGPVKLTDTTTVVEADAPRRLLLEVRIRPFLTGPVELTLEPDGDGTCITIDERATGWIGGAIPDLVTSPLIALRNAEALRRLASMAWARRAALAE